MSKRPRTDGNSSGYSDRRSEGKEREEEQPKLYHKGKDRERDHNREERREYGSHNNSNSRENDRGSGRGRYGGRENSRGRGGGRGGRQSEYQITNIGSPNSSQPISLVSNYFPVHFSLNQPIYQYSVKIEPTLERYSLIFVLLHPHEAEIGPYICNKSIVYSLVDFKEKTLKCDLREGSYVVTLVKVKKVTSEDGRMVYFQVFNSAFRRILQAAEGFVQLGRRALFDKTKKQVFDRLKFEIWPGYVTSLCKNVAGDIMVMSSLSFKILRKETAYDIIFRDKHSAEIILVNQSVLTSYGKKDRTYRIREIKWDMTPESTFSCKGKETSFREYYKQVYAEEIRHRDQPLLLAESSTERRQKRKGLQDASTKEDQKIFLIPELCIVTGITDEMKSDRSIMTAISNVTRLSSVDRMNRLEEFIAKFANPKRPDIKAQLESWGIRVDRKPIEFEGKVLAPQPIYFADNSTYPPNNKAEWSGFWKEGLRFHTPVNIKKWTLISNERDLAAVDNLMKFLPNIASKFGVSIDKPTIVTIKRDDIKEWERELKKTSLDKDFVIAILPRNTPEKYNIVKRILTTELGIPSQCIVSKTVQEDKIQSVLTKVVQQINTKMGGVVWKVPIDLPPGPTMICGIDICHDKIHKRGSVAAFIATVNSSLDQFFSKTILLQREADIVSGLTDCMREALKYFHSINGTFPANIFVYRDGVGEGQLGKVKDTEIAELKDAFKEIHIQPKLVFIVVQKKINTRIFTTQGYNNPPPGTVVDTCITTDPNNLPEFFLIPQFVHMSATVCPSHYIILEMEIPGPIINLQFLTYRMCHMYYNWSGTIRVPAPVQYAHKLSFHVAQSLGRDAHVRLNGRLFYL